MVKETKSKRKKTQSKDDTAKVAPSDLNLKSVTYEYDDGFCCTVVTSAEAPPSSAFSLITSTANTNNMKKANTANTSNINSAATEVTASSKPTATLSPRSYKDLRIGVKKKEAIEIVEQFNFPDRPFTIKEVLFATGINHWYVTAYIKANAKVVGNAPKQPGERGKVAKLYQIEKKA